MTTSTLQRGHSDLGMGSIGSGYMGRTYAECVDRYNTGARLIAIAGGSRAPGLAAVAMLEAGYRSSAQAQAERLELA